MNVVVYVVDCLRSDHLSCYGYDRETTPNIDCIAEHGLRYSNCSTTATWTRPASVSLLTGTYPPTHGVRHRGDTIPRGLKRLPEYLAARGFETVGVSTMGNVSSTIGHDVGFDSFLDLYKDEEVIRRRERTSTDHQKLLHEEPQEIALPRAKDITDALRPRIESADDDLFAFCWSIDPHLPFDPPDGYRQFVDPEYSGPIDGHFDTLPGDPSDQDLAHLRDLYDCEIAYVDEQIGELVATLEKQEVYDDTLLIVLGDHGEAFHEHGTILHGNCPYEEVLRVPLIIKPPSEWTESPAVIDEPISIVDVCPTILNALDVGDEEIPEYVQGRAIPPFGEPAPDVTVFSETQLWDFLPVYYSVRTDRWKYICTDRPSTEEVIRRLVAHRQDLTDWKFVAATIRDSILAGIDANPHEQLYDVGRDPGEQTDRQTDEPEVAARMRQRLNDWLQECERLSDAIGRQTPGNIDPDTTEQLRRLGYRG